MKSEEIAKMIESYPEEMANGEYFAVLLRSYLLKTDTGVGASKEGWTEIETAMRNYCNLVLMGCEIGMEAFQAGYPDTKKLSGLFVEPSRMFLILLLMGAVKEHRGFDDVQDPLFIAALYAVKLRGERKHPEDIVYWHRLEESDAKASVARFSGALAKVIGKKNGDLQTYLRLRFTIFFRVINGRWPTCTEIEKQANASGGERTWLRFRQQHGIDWLEKGKPGRKKGGRIPPTI